MFFCLPPSLACITRQYKIVSYSYRKLAKRLQEGRTNLLHTIEPFSDELSVLLALLPHRNMTGVLEGYPLGLFNLPEVVRGDKVLGEVPATVDDE